MIFATAAFALSLVATAPLDRASVCTPAPRHGVRVTVRERFAHVTLDRFLTTYFSERFNNAAAPVMGIKSRALLVDEERDGVRYRRVQMRPAMSLPGPLRAFGSDEQVRYDEISNYDPAAHRIHFFIDNAACDQVKYAGTISFVEEGDGVRLSIDAVLQVDAVFVGGLVEELVKGGVRDGYARLATFMQSYLDRDAAAPTVIATLGAVPVASR